MAGRCFLTGLHLRHSARSPWWKSTLGSCFPSFSSVKGTSSVPIGSFGVAFGPFAVHGAPVGAPRRPSASGRKVLHGRKASVQPPAGQDCSQDRARMPSVQSHEDPVTETLGPLPGPSMSSYQALGGCSPGLERVETQGSGGKEERNRTEHWGCSTRQGRDGFPGPGRGRWGAPFSGGCMS